MIDKRTIMINFIHRTTSDQSCTIIEQKGTKQKHV